MEPRQPGAWKHVAKKVTVDDRVAKWGKYALYSNNGLLFCKPCGKKVDYLRDESIQHHILTDDCNCDDMYVVAHRMCWHQGMRDVRNAASSNHRKSKSRPKNGFWETIRKRIGIYNKKRSPDLTGA